MSFYMGVAKVFFFVFYEKRLHLGHENPIHVCLLRIYYINVFVF